MSDALQIGAASFMVTLVLPIFAIKILRRLGAVDVPNHRSSHTIPTVRGVGVACLTALWVGGALGLLGARLDRSSVFVMVLGSTMGILGLIEDLRGLRISVRVTGQLAIGLAAGLVLTLNDSRSAFAVPLVAVWIAGYVNVANFMDGVDSISGLHGAVAGSYYAALGAYEVQPVLVVVGVLTAAIFLGFLPWNVVRACRVFLGDVGSYLLGALVALLAAATWLGGCGVVAAVAPTSIYIADTAWTIVQRMLRHEPLTVAHRTHVYQRLIGVGWTHVESGVTVAIVSAICGGAALVAKMALIPQIAAGLVIVAIAAAYLSLPRAIAARRRGQGAIV